MLLFMTEYLNFSHLSEKNMSFTDELSLEEVYSHCGRQRWNLSSNGSGKVSKEEKCQFQHSLIMPGHWLKSNAVPGSLLTTTQNECFGRTVL